MLAPALTLTEPVPSTLYIAPPPPRRGDPTGKPCELCGSDGATHTWGICEACRWERQREADAEVRRLRREHPDWYPEMATRKSA